VTTSVNEQVAGHKVTVRPVAPAASGRRRASCQCGWQSRIGSTEQVMPEIRTHLDTALRETQTQARPPTKPHFRKLRP
jgi:hypothetical protein